MVKTVLPRNYISVKKANLLYEITVDNNLEVTVDPKEPMRGQIAFQTDFCIFSKKYILMKKKKKEILLPRVVFEFKNDISTHDVITYSNKATRHKQIYPYLRYGLVIYNRPEIPRKFFIHNEGIDFFLAIKRTNKNLNTILKDIIKREIKMSKILESTIFGYKKFGYFGTDIKLKNFKLHSKEAKRTS